jgi:hypothetical protein
LHGYYQRYITTISDSNDGEKLEPLYNAEQKVKWHNHYEKQHEVFSKKKKKKQPAIPFLGIYPKEVKFRS